MLQLFYKLQLLLLLQYYQTSLSSSVVEAFHHLNMIGSVNSHSPNFSSLGKTTATRSTTRSSSSSKFVSSSSRLYASVSEDNINPASELLYKEQEKLLIDQGEQEAIWMKDTWTPLEANVVKGSGGSGGFGGGGSSGGGKGKNNKKKKNKKGGGVGGGSSSSTSTSSGIKSQAKSHAQVLKRDGVVRIDNILSSNQADDLRSEIYKMKDRAVELVESGDQYKSIDLFANVLLKNNRYDMTIPLDESTSITTDKTSMFINTLVDTILTKSSIGQTITNLLSEDAVLYEYSCLISDPGSERQVIHPDTPYDGAASRGVVNGQPVLYTCFIALQDITIDMGPTIWIPKTHTQEKHLQFKDETISNNENDPRSGKQILLSSDPSKLGLLPKGCCAIFDSRLLHAGGTNISKDKSRALLYCSFKNPNCRNAGNPGSIRPNLIDKYTLSQLKQKKGSI